MCGASVKDLASTHKSRNRGTAMKWEEHLRLGFLAVALATSFATSATADHAYTTGHDLMEQCTTQNKYGFFEGVCLGYVIGIADSMIAGNTINGYRACLPSDASLGQLKDVVVKWLTNNLEKRNLAANRLVAAAFHDAFPCPK
jgi:hypothetical protein